MKDRRQCVGQLRKLMMFFLLLFFRNQISKFLNSNGGTVQFMFSPTTCTHLVATADEVSGKQYSSKIQSLRKFKEKSLRSSGNKAEESSEIVIVTDQFFYQSINLGKLVAVSLFKMTLPPTTSSLTQPYRRQDEEEGKEEEEEESEEEEEDAGLSSHVDPNLLKVAVWSYNPGGKPYFPTEKFTIVRSHVLQAMDFVSNCNKFYVMELHRSDETNSNSDNNSDSDTPYTYRLLTHHGRTDELEGKKVVGQRECRFMSSLEHAEVVYDHILREKTSPEKGYKEVYLLSVSSKIGRRE